MKPRKSFLVRKRRVPVTLLDIRRKELRIARLDVIRYEDLAKQKPKDAKVLSELSRYRDRVSSLELAVQTLEKVVQNC